MNERPVSHKWTLDKVGWDDTRPICSGCQKRMVLQSLEPSPVGPPLACFACECGSSLTLPWLPPRQH